jgi:6-phosphogluconolactonase
MGPDGHVASLFPGRPALDERERLVVPVDDAPKPPPRRLTMTLPLMAGARTICVAAFGREKAAAVHAAVNGPDSDLPVARLLRGHPDVLCLFDPAAASRLRAD